MTMWEDCTDEDVIADWVDATTRTRPPARPEDATTPGPDRPPVHETAGGGVSGGGATWRIGSTNHRVDPDERRRALMNQETRDDLHLVQRVRGQVVDLVLEHPHMSPEADRRLVALGIRFAVWSLTKTSDGTFDAFRDLTEDRITAFVSEATHLGVGSRASYAAALRRLAAGPVNRHRGERRMAVAPLSPRVEDGLWAAADAFAPWRWEHAEAKTLLALTFGAGALADEINRVSPDDVLTETTETSLRTTVRLMRGRTWEVRDVPVIPTRYAEWLADRATQLVGHDYLYKPQRVNRRNAINAGVRALARANAAFERFDLHAARNTWAATWLQRELPFPLWAAAAGVGPGTHLPTDLLAHLPTPAPAEVTAAFRRATPLGS